MAHMCMRVHNKGSERMKLPRCSAAAGGLFPLFVVLTSFLVMNLVCYGFRI